MAEKLTTQPYKGSRDFYPAEMRLRTWMFGVMSKTVETFGFEKIDAPIIEPIEIYLAKTSEEIVGQQIYNFTDRGGRNVVIRPEMTPTVARMVAAKIRELPRPIRWYSIPNLWRYEKMGKGRLREHWQLNVDILGAKDEFLADIEILQIALGLMKAFGAQSEHYKVFLNHREILNNTLGEILSLPQEKWAPVSRIMDKRDKVSHDAFLTMLEGEDLKQEQINLLIDYMDSGTDFLQTHLATLGESAKYLLEVLETLQELGHGEMVEYNPTVVRGFDYYTGIVFEIFDTHPENRRSLFGGGRYDNLVSAFTKDQINAVGFGMGDVTFAEFLKLHNLAPEIDHQGQVYVACFPDRKLKKSALALGARLREAGLNVEISSGNNKLSKQFDEAHAKNTPYILLQGENELETGVVTLKDMNSGNQEEIALDQIETRLKELLG